MSSSNIFRCQECGSAINKSGLKIHLTSEKCKRFQSLNQRCYFQCRKCNTNFEKCTLLDTHVCNPGVAVNTVSDSFRCEFYKNILKSVGILDMHIDWSKIPGNSLTYSSVHEKVNEKVDEKVNENVEDNLSITGTVTDISEKYDTDTEDIPDTKETEEKIKYTLSLQKLPTSTLPYPFADQIITDEAFVEGIKRINEIVKDLSTHGLETDDGDNRYMLIGEELCKLVTSNYNKLPEWIILEQLSTFDKFIKSVNDDIHSRSDLIAGVELCDRDMSNYILFNLGILESKPLDIKKIKEKYSYTSPFNLSMLSQCYTFIYAVSDVSFFLEHLMMGNKFRYNKLDEKFYYQVSNGKWMQDPFLLSFTYQLVHVIIDKCSSIFKKIYKSVYFDNKYRKDWMKNEQLKELTQLYKNVEIAIPVFDLNHIIRKKIPLATPVDNISSDNICTVENNRSLYDEFALMSTRIHYGVPGFEIGNNIYDVMFDSCDSEIGITYLKKYIGGLSRFKDEYQPSGRFKNQVQSELEGVKNL